MTENLNKNVGSKKLRKMDSAKKFKLVREDR